MRRWFPVMALTIVGWGFGWILPDIDHDGWAPSIGAAIGFVAGMLLVPLPKRFRLRTLLTATALVAVVLGLIAYLTRQ